MNETNPYSRYSSLQEHQKNKSGKKTNLLLLPLIAGVLEGCSANGNTLSDGESQARSVTLDNAKPNLDERDSGNKQIVTGDEQNNKIVTGSGNDEVHAAGGDDMIRTGTGVDTVDAGAGDDVIVVVGANTPDMATYTQYSITDITDPRGSGIDVSSIVSLDEINNNLEDEGYGDTIDGGTHGVNGDTLIVYGTTDLRFADIRNVENIIINSDVTFNIEQLQELGLVAITGGDGAFLRLRSIDGEDAEINLDELNLDNVEYIDVGRSVTVVADDSAALGGIKLILGEGEVQVDTSVGDEFTSINLVPGITISIDGGSQEHEVTPDSISLQTFGGQVNTGFPIPGGGLRFVTEDDFTVAHDTPIVESFVGTNNRDSIVMGPSDTAAGRGGSDYFVIDEKAGESYSLSYTITDFEQAKDFIVLDGASFQRGQGGTYAAPEGTNELVIVFNQASETLTISQVGHPDRVYNIVLEGITLGGAINIPASAFQYEYVRQNLATEGTRLSPEHAAHIWINSAPHVHGPEEISVKHGSPFQFDAFEGLGLSVSDTNTNILKVVLTVENGILSLSDTGAIALGSGTNRISMKGTQSEINSILRGLSFEQTSAEFTPGTHINMEVREIIQVGEPGIGSGIRFQEVEGETTTAQIKVNSDPVVTSKTSFRVFENDPDAVIAFTAIDPDGYQTGQVRYEIIGGNDEGLFEIDEFSGEITLTAALDKEYINERGFNDVRPAYRLTVRVTDDENRVTETRVTVDIRNVDEPPVVQDGVVFRVNEYVEATDASDARFVIGGIYASQPDDSYGLIRFRIEGEWSSLFDVITVDDYDGDDARIRLIRGQENMFDYENGINEYTLTIIATERDWIGEDLETTVTATVRILDVNEKATEIYLDRNIVSQGIDTSLGATEVGELSSNDPEGDRPNYRIKSVMLDGEAIDGVFRIINGNSLVIVRDATIAEFGSEYEVTISWNGYSDRVNEETFSVHIGGAQLPPTFVIQENVPVVERHLDVDFGGRTDLQIVRAEGDGVSLIDGNTIKVSGTYDHEALNGRLPITLTLEQTDGTTYTQTLYVEVQDQQEPPAPDAASYSFNIDEDAALNSLVGRVRATDPDGDTITYSITSGNTNEMFSINASTGAIKVNKPLDHEDTSVYTLTVTISQGEGLPSIDRQVTINIGDVNEAPAFQQSSYTFSAGEDSTVIGTVSAADEDAGQTLSYEIHSGNVDDTFQIDSSTGEITLADGKYLDYEFGTRTYTLRIRVSDGNGERDRVEVTINVEDVNEAPYFPSEAYAVSIDEDEIGQREDSLPVAYDPEGGELTYSIVSSDPEGIPLEVDPTTRSYTITGSGFDYETNSEYTVVIGATDSSGNTGTATLTVFVGPINEAPSEPTLDGNHLSATSNTAPGAITIGTLTATDPEGQPVSYELVSVVLDKDASDVTSGFVIDDTGRLQVRQGYTITAAAGDTYTVTVKSSDGEESSANTEFTVTVGGGVSLDPTYSIDENDRASKNIDVTFAGLDNPLLEAATIETGTIQVIPSLSGTQVRVTGPFDYESLENGYVEVELTVSHGEPSSYVEGVETANRETITQTVYIQINDVDETPAQARILPIAEKALPENNDDETHFGTDVSDTFEYGVDSSNGEIHGSGISNILGFNAEEDKILLTDSDTNDKIDFSEMLDAYGREYTVSVHQAESLNLDFGLDLQDGEYDTIEIDFSGATGEKTPDVDEKSVLRVVLSEKINEDLLKADANMFNNAEDFASALGAEETLLFG